MDITVHTVNAFTDPLAPPGAGGNPAGVVLQADGLSLRQRQAIAARMGLSETAFVSAATSATRRLEFFTPTQQIPHCGHATIAAFWLLQHTGQLCSGLHSKETIDGNRDILIEGERIAMEQRAPRYTELTLLADQHPVLDALQIKADDLLPGVPPAVVNTGNGFLVVGLRDRDRLAALQPRQDAIHRLSDTYDLVGFYVYCLQTDRPGRHAAARMFAPRYGIPEEAATGTAAGPLACWLHDRLDFPDTSFSLEQGWLMSQPSPSLIEVALNVGAQGIQRLWAGGTARLTRTQQLSLST